MQQNTIAILGGGSFGTAIANLLAQNNGAIWHWMRDESQVQTILKTRRNPRYLQDIPIIDAIIPTSDLALALQADTIFVALPSSALRFALKDHNLAHKKIISLTKGIEPQSFKLMSEVLTEIAPKATIGVLSGPNLAREIAEGVPSASVIASNCADLCKYVQTLLHCPRFRLYASSDCYGVELGGALKNIYAIIAGMAHALKMGENTRSMLITRALAEMTRFAVSLGANPMTFLGLAGVGDLIATCSSSKSRNFRLGLALGAGQSLTQAMASIGETIEGINTLQVVQKKAAQIGIYMPLVEGLNAIIFTGATIEQAWEKLTQGEAKADVDFISAQGF